ncbi:helix-turn-helix domain-containing protein [Plantactinospora siamensis]|uniref:Helix-turn-helix domain-containing protein n=1 Tax=Plantactinospora siamensis TaxID=555372 RepID=A0ABV6P242_9ACTN
MYREQPAGPELAGTILWASVRESGAGPTRVLPDGCLDLIWSSTHGLFVAGPDTAAHLAAGMPGECCVALRFAPGTGPAVIGVPASELRDRRWPLADLWPAAVARELADRMAEAAATGAERAGGEWAGAERAGGEWAGGERAGGEWAGAERAGGVLLTAAADRLRAAGGPDRLAGVVARGMAAGRPVAAVAAEVGLGERQLHRRSRELFGYGPKTLARILRLRRALTLVYAGVPVAEVAFRTGYADQPHLSREVRALAGVPLGALTAGGG